MSSLSTILGRAYPASVPGPFSSGPFAYNFATVPLPDGFVQAGEGGMIASKMLTVIPYCNGPAGTTFSVRVVYWNAIGGDPGSRILVGVPLVELACVASNAAGQYGSLQLDSDHRLCDQITLTSGSLGLDGALYSGVAGCDLPAMAQVEIQGARFVSFDFQAVDGNGQPLLNYCVMNAFWAKCD